MKSAREPSHEILSRPLPVQMFFKEEHKKGRQYSDLYELVQHAGYVLPRM